VKDIFFPKRMWRRATLKRRYDVVVIGGGAHGLATAYYLAKNHGVRDVAVLEKSYLGAGGSGRNTTIIRSNYRTPEGAEFYRESVKLYETLSQELNFNTMFSQHGHLTLAHSDRGMIVSAERAEVNQLLGIDSRVVGRDEVKALCPQINLDGTFPSTGPSTTPLGASSATTRSCGATLVAPTAAAPRSTRASR
jgi:sarcosine oxidase subunit beta